MLKTALYHLSAAAVILVCLPSLLPQETPGSHSANNVGAIRTERGNHSFRGLDIPVGQVSAPFNIDIINGGSLPVTGLTAVTHGDFVIARNGCSHTLTVGTAAESRCTISVSFQPTHPGLRVGNLTVSAPGVHPLVVALDAGTPIDFGSLLSGETSVQWVQLATGGPLTGSVTSPFTMALQGPYAYGSIDGITFAGTSSSAASSGTLFLGVQLQAAAIGSLTGTVSLSDGSTYSLSANVSGNPQLMPAAIDYRDIPLQSPSGAATFTVANDSSSPVSIDAIVAAAPFSETSNCGSLLQGNSTCSVQVIFTPTATGESTGQLMISTGAGNLVASLTGDGVPQMGDSNISPASIFLNYESPGAVSPPQTVTVTNRNSSLAMTVQYLGLGLCTSSVTSNCFQVLPNDCATIAPNTSCDIQLQYLFGPSEGIVEGDFNLLITQGSGGWEYAFFYQVSGAVSSGSSNSLVVWPASLVFAPTLPGKVSDEQLLTIFNESTLPMFVGNTTAAGSGPSSSTFAVPYNFSVDSACGVLAPGAACTAHVRSLPVGSGSSSSDYSQASGLLIGPSSDQFAIADFQVQGYGIPTTALATPSYFPFGPLIQPVFNGGPVPDGTLVPFSLPVRNIGAAPLIISNVYETYPGGSPPPAGGTGVFAVDPSQCAAPIAPGDECTLNVTWDAANCPPNGPPGLDCYDNATLIVESNADSSPDAYSFYGDHYNVGGQIPATYSPPPQPSSYYFGRVQVGESASQSIHFSGTTGVIPSVSITGKGYYLRNGCARLAGSQTASCTVDIIFAPDAPGFSAGAVKFVSSQGLTTNPLSGSGIPSQLRVFPPVVSFPSTLVYQSPPDQKVTLINISDSALALGATYVEQIRGVFQIASSDCADFLAAHTSCSMIVSFTPYNWVGANQSSLNFSFGIDDGLESIPLSAPVTSLVLTPPFFDFGTVHLRQSASQTFSVENIGTATQLYGTAQIQGAVISGVHESDFVIAANTCTSGVLLSGSQTCSVTVQFAPSAAGRRRAVLTVTTSNAGVVSANLVGEGVSPGCRPAAVWNGNQHGCPCDHVPCLIPPSGPPARTGDYSSTQ